MRAVLAAVLLLAAGLTGCLLPPADAPEAPSAAAPELSVESGGSDGAMVPLQAAVLVVRDEIQLATLAVTPPAPEPATDQAFSSCAVHLITRWEVSGEAAYTRRYQGVIWPGGASGPTWGIGYDGGHQTRLDIARDWADHANRNDLVQTSGVIGTAAKQRLPDWAQVRTPYPFAAKVFVQTSLPQYESAARRALGPGFVSLPPGARCGLVSMGYNRGWGMTGARQAEKRAIRDLCIAQLGGDLACIATQIRASKRLWPDANQRGLRDRREDEARRVLAQGVAPTAATPRNTGTTPPKRRLTPPAPGHLPGHGPATTLAAN